MVTVIMGDMRQRLASVLVDVALALGVALIVASVAVRAEEPGSRSPVLAGWGLAVVVGLLTLVRRRRPVPVLLGLALTVLAYNLAGFPGIGYVWPLLAGFYTVAAAGRLAVGATVGTVLVGIDIGWLLFAERHPVLPVLAMALPEVIITGLALALGDAARSRRGWAAATRERLRRISEEKERQARQAIVEERLRIARELHDVTAHTFAVVAVQLNVALDALHESPGEAEQALEAARTVSRQAIGELRSAVHVLREPGMAPVDSSPLPGPGWLDGLVARIRTAGPQVELVETGSREAVPAAAGLAVYRIVQEALTNTVKHAGASKVTVEVDYGQDVVAVRVRDDGTEPITDGAGSGLIGLRERAGTLGGRLTAGPGPDGGFLVEATLPTAEKTLR